MATRRMSDPAPTPETEETTTVEATEPYRSPNTLVRVKHPESGDEFTTTLAMAQRLGGSILDKKAVDRYGNRLPRKPKLTIEGERK